MKYNDIKNRIFATAVRPDGYNGQEVSVGFARDQNGTIMEVHDRGYHPAGYPIAFSDSAALVSILSKQSIYRDITVVL